MNVAITNMGFGNLICMTPALQALYKMQEEPIGLVCQTGRTPLNSFAHELFDRCEFAYVVDEPFGQRVEAVFNLNNRFPYTRMHEVLHHMQIPRNLGYTGEIPDLYVSTKPFDWEDGFEDVVIVGNDHAPGWEKKAWPHFDEMLKTLGRYFPLFRVIKVGFDRNVYRYVHLDMSQKLSFSEIAWMVSKASLVITNDSYLLHIADALVKPMVCIFGPTLVSKNRPWQSSYALVRTQKFCAPCHGTALFDWCEKADCMRSIDPATVIRATRRLVKNVIL